MKRLQSLESFKASGLSQKSMSKLHGGANVEPTGAGCYSTENLELCSTGCISYTSDTPDGSGGITYHGTKDIKVGDCD